MTAVCAVQLAPERGAAGRNADLVSGEIEAAAAEGAELVVFPEAALTGYVFHDRGETLASAVSVSGPELRRVGLAAAGAGVWCVVGAIEREGESLYNSAFLLSPAGAIAGRYRKIHTLCLGADRFTRPGGDPPRAFDLPFGRIGIHLCYDGSFPETARALRLEGAGLLLLPTNWPRLRLKREIVQVRAWENHAFYLAVNRVGTEEGVTFEGGSLAADPDGRLLLEAGPEPGRFLLTLDLAVADATREVVEPGSYELDLIADRRPERYGAITAPRPGHRPTGSRLSGVEPPGPETG